MLKRCKNRAGESLLSKVETLEITEAQKWSLIQAVMAFEDIEDSACAELLEVLGIDMSEAA